MRVLIVGASGLVGHELLRSFSSLPSCAVGGTYCSREEPGLLHLDIRDRDEVRRRLKAESPDIILLPAADPYVDKCETNPEETRAVNVEGTKNVIHFAGEEGKKLVFFSTDYVFDGKAGPYAEDSAPNPIGEYGRQKLEIERALQEEVENYLIVRTAVVYGWEKNGINFVARMLAGTARGETISVPRDQVGSPTYAPNLAESVRELTARDARGIYHVAGGDVMDRCAFAKTACEVFGRDPALIVPVSTAELQQKALRPLNAGLKVEKISRELGLFMVGAREGLTKMRDEDGAGRRLP